VGIATSVNADVMSNLDFGTRVINIAIKVKLWKDKKQIF
jgi:hypothetical protein